MALNLFGFKLKNHCRPIKVSFSFSLLSTILLSVVIFNFFFTFKSKPPRKGRASLNSGHLFANLVLDFLRISSNASN